MRSNKGQFIKGESASPATQFTKGCQNWRPWNLHRDKSWLETQYIEKRRGAADIAAEMGVTENAIYFWLGKHEIPTRDMSEIRAGKKWGAVGEKNPMFGRYGILNPNWQGGLTPMRQSIYAKSEWKNLKRDVRKRDVCCRLCESSEHTQIHHIDRFSLAPLLVLDIGNVILLCKKCHLQMRGKEEQWKRKLFKLLKDGKEEKVW